MDIHKHIEETQLSKTIEVFHSTRTNEQGEVIPFGVKVQNRYPAVGLALKEAAEKFAASEDA